VTADTAGSLSIVGHDAAAVDVDGSTAERLRTTLDTRLRESLAAQRGWIDADGRAGSQSGEADDGDASGEGGTEADTDHVDGP